MAEPTERELYRSLSLAICECFKIVTWRRTTKSGKLESMCHDRVGWKARCSMWEPRETSPLSSVSVQHVTADCSYDDDDDDDDDYYYRPYFVRRLAPFACRVLVDIS